MQSPVALRPLAPPACFASPEAYTRAVYSTRRQRPHTVVIHASFNAPQTDGEAVKSFCSVARMSSIGSKNLGCRLCVKLPRLPAAMVIPEGYVLFSVMCGFGPLPLTCLFRYAFRSCGQLPAVSVSRPAHSVLSRLPPKAYVFPRGFRSYRGAIPGAV